MENLFKRCPACDAPNPLGADGRTAPECFHCGHEFYRDSMSNIKTEARKLVSESHFGKRRISHLDIERLLDRAYRAGAHDMFDYHLEQDYAKLCATRDEQDRK